MYRLGLVVLELGKPLEPLRQVPVPLAEQLHRRRQQHAPDDRRVEENRHGQPDAELLEERNRERAEDGEHADHDDRGAGDDAGGRLDPVCDGVVHLRAAVERLPDPADDEDVVVHRKAEQDHEQEQRHDHLDPDSVLEDEHEHAVCGGDREQVEQDRFDRHHDRAERDQHQHEREEKDERDHGRQVRLQLVARVSPRSRPPGDAGLGVRDGADGLGNDRPAQQAEGGVRCCVGAVACNRDGDVRNRALLVHIDGDGFEGAAAGDCPLLELRDRLAHRRRPHARCLDDDIGGQCRAGERRLHPVVHLDHLERLRERLGSLRREAQLHGRRGERQQQRGGDSRRQRRPAQDAVDDRSPDPSFAVVAAEPTDEGDAQPVDLVAEPREHCREHGQRAEHRDGDDEDRGEGEGGERLVAGEKHAGHCNDHGQAGDEHGAT